MVVKKKKRKPVKKKKLNEYFRLMLDAKKKNLESFIYKPKSGKHAGKTCKYVRKIVDFGKGKKKTKTPVYKFSKYV